MNLRTFAEMLIMEIVRGTIEERNGEWDNEFADIFVSKQCQGGFRPYIVGSSRFLLKQNSTDLFTFSLHDLECKTITVLRLFRTGQDQHESEGLWTIKKVYSMGKGGKILEESDDIPDVSNDSFLSNDIVRNCKWAIKSIPV